MLTNNNQLTNLKDNNIIAINTIIIELVQLIRLDCKRFYDFKTNT